MPTNTKIDNPHSPSPSSSTAGWSERSVRAFLETADIRINGTREWDIAVHHSRFYTTLMYSGLVGLGDSYIEGWWDCPAIDQMLVRAMDAGLDRKISGGLSAIWGWLMHRVFNLQRRGSARRNVQWHYDLGNDLFQAMLDPRMIYSCGYWKQANNLSDAQEAKLDLVCRKIGLQPGQRVLDIGCGWGGFAKFAAEKYRASVVGVTLSTAQVEWGQKICRDLPVEIRLADYRDVRERFDHVVSIGMFEHVGQKNYRTMMEVVDRCLNPSGLFLLHTMGTRSTQPNTTDGEMAWVNKHIFPGAVVPSAGQLGEATAGLFVIEDLQNFGADYDPTVLAWEANFQAARSQLAGRYDERFLRMWTFYLRLIAAAFRVRKYQLWQVVLSRGVRGGYTAVR